MIIAIDLANDRALYLQIADGVRRGLVEGTVVSGDRLPPGRELASTLGVNLETVQRAYRLLADEGLVVSRVGRGTQIADDIDMAPLQIGQVVEQLVQRAVELGIPPREVIRLVERRLTQLET